MQDDKGLDYIGKVLKDTYRVDSKLGEGGMAVVFKGQDILMDMPVAIKLLYQNNLKDEKELKRFLREARTQAKLIHQNVVGIRAIVKEVDQVYIVMEFVDGYDLEECILTSDNKPVLPLPQLKYVFKQVLEAMAHAHKQNVIHRDLKPSNIMVTHSGSVKMADFGIAREINDHRLTTTGTVVGTPVYMSPEQLKSAALDHRTDIYSLGITLYELLAGHTPFILPSEGNVPLFDLMSRHMSQTPTPLAQLGINIPPALEQVVQKSLAKQPEDRFENCEAFWTAMEAALAGIPAEPPDYSAITGTADLAAYKGSTEIMPEAPADLEPPVSEPKEAKQKPSRPKKKRSRQWLLKWILAIGICILGGIFVFWDQLDIPDLSRSFMGSEPPKRKGPSDTDLKKAFAQAKGIKWKDKMSFVKRGCFTQGKGGRLNVVARYSPERKVCLQGFMMDKFEVSAGQYRECIKAGACQKLVKKRLFRKAKDMTFSLLSHEPVQWTLWSDAKAFCRWVGKRLPTETEWEYAARGNSPQEYPWGGKKPDCKRAYFRSCWKWPFGKKDKRIDPKVRKAGRSPFGLYDMSGNVKEWTQDCYKRQVYRIVPIQNPYEKKNCRKRVLRGGSWKSKEKKIRTYYRHVGKIGKRIEDHGFRCAWGLDLLKKSK